jgi:hypothetical protein
MTKEEWRGMEGRHCRPSALAFTQRETNKGKQAERRKGGWAERKMGRWAERKKTFVHADYTHHTHACKNQTFGHVFPGGYFWHFFRLLCFWNFGSGLGQNRALSRAKHPLGPVWPAQPANRGPFLVFVLEEFRLEVAAA